MFFQLYWEKNVNCLFFYLLISKFIWAQFLCGIRIAPHTHPISRVEWYWTFFAILENGFLSPIPKNRQILPRAAHAWQSFHLKKNTGTQKMKFLEKFSDALRQANKQHFRENIWIWGPYQFGTTFRVPKLFLSKIPPPYPSASPPPI